MDRKYTVREIDALRAAVESKYLWGAYRGPMGNGSMSRSYREEEKAAVVEAQVRTHMLAGQTAEDLYASERPRVDGQHLFPARPSDRAP